MPLSSTIKQRDPSIFYTLARELLVQTRYYIPWENPLYIQNNNEAPLFYNPATNYILAKLLNNDRVVIKIETDTWKVWYPLDKKVDMEVVNEKLEFFDIEMAEYVIQANTDDEIKSKYSLDDTTRELIYGMLPGLRKRLSLEEPRVPQYCMILEDKANIMKHHYESMWIG